MTGCWIGDGTGLTQERPRLAKVDVPTLVIDGATSPWMSRSADAVRSAVPGSKRRTLEGQPHNVDPAAIAPVLVEFFAPDAPRRSRSATPPLWLTVADDRCR